MLGGAGITRVTGEAETRKENDVANCCSRPCSVSMVCFSIRMGGWLARLEELISKMATRLSKSCLKQTLGFVFTCVHSCLVFENRPTFEIPCHSTQA